MNEKPFESSIYGRVMTLKEAAEYLHTSYSTVYRLVTEGELPAFRLRTGWRTTSIACEAFVRHRLGEQKKSHGREHGEAMIP